MSYISRRRFVVGGLGAAAGLAMLTACNRQTPAAPAGSTPSTGAGGQAGQQAPAKASSKENVTIRLLTTESDPPSQKVYNAAVTEFTGQNPNIKIEVEYVGFDARTEKLVTGLGAKKVAHLAQLVPHEVVEYAILGYLSPLDEIVAETGGREKWQVTSLDATVVNGKNYALPYAGDGYRTLWCRMDLLEKNAIQPPTTWDEWKAAAEKLTQDTNGDGAVDQFGVALPGAKAGWTVSNYMRFLWQTGETVFDKDFNVTFGKEGSVRALQFYKDMVKFGPPAYASYSYSETIDAYVTGQVATQPYAGRTLMRVYENAPQLVEVTRGIKHPVGPIGGDVGLVNWDMYGVFNEKVGVNPAEQEAAKKFLKFLVIGKVATDFMLTVPGHMIPPHLSTLEDQNLWNGHPLMISHRKEIDWLYNTQNSLMEVTEAGAGITAQKVTPGVVNPHWNAVASAKVIETMVQRAIVSNEEPKAAVDWGASEIKRVTEESKKKLKQ